MAEILTPDLCVIGGGSGGLTVAAAARAFDASVVLVEKGMMGGDCLNTGCVPSKALIAAARHAEAARVGVPFGIAAAEPKVNFGRVHDHVHQVIASIAPHDSVERFEALGVTVLKDHARFIDKKTLQVGDTLVRARRFVVATGSRAAVPPIPGLSETPYLTNETIFDLRRAPSHLIVIGAGPIGLELAQALRRLGCEVVVVEAAEPLAREEVELRDIALRAIRAEGIEIRERTKVVSTEARGQGVAVSVQPPAGDDGLDRPVETITGTHLLVAVGRAANIEDMGLDLARVKTENGAIRVNRGLRTSNRRIYAIGDVIGGMQFTHLAGYHAGLVIRNALFGLPVRVKPYIVPRATYTEPEIAQVGMTEVEAQQRLRGNFKVVRWSFGENDRARAERQTEGLVKVIFDRRGRILGAGIAGAQAGELISLFALVIANGLSAKHLTAMIAPYPTLSEIARRIGVEYYKDQLENPWLGRLLRFNRRLP
jgi:pyruvate/2-oxoglutarate dehydrogenase complex dihydrolipoamide dehydrogenase (E3) component